MATPKPKNGIFTNLAVKSNFLKLPEILLYEVEALDQIYLQQQLLGYPPPADGELTLPIGSAPKYVEI